MNRAFLSLGSNIAAEKNLPAAVQLLREYGVVRTSSGVWESPALEGADHPDYLNAAVLLETPLSAVSLRHQAINHIERVLGRVRNPRNPHAPRPIDIDIMLFNRDIISLGHRHIPDGEILERAFVALALAELDPDYIHPLTGQTLAQIASGFSDESLRFRRREDVNLMAEKGISTARV
jgi:2-amino-4-hydroxy-6-hydroxymethyldihydropteridine diphosphokinase